MDYKYETCVERDRYDSDDNIYRKVTFTFQEPGLSISYGDLVSCVGISHYRRFRNNLNNSLDDKITFCDSNGKAGIIIDSGNKKIIFRNKTCGPNGNNIFMYAVDIDDVRETLVKFLDRLILDLEDK